MPLYRGLAQVRTTLPHMAGKTRQAYSAWPDRAYFFFGRTFDLDSQLKPVLRMRSLADIPIYLVISREIYN